MTRGVRWMDALLLSAVWAWGAGLPARAEDPAPPPRMLPSKGLKLPMDRYEDGKIKTLLTAGVAEAPVVGLGEIKASQVKVEFYDPDGATNTVLTADECRYDQTKGRIVSTSAVKMVQEGNTITGIGMECDVNEKVVKILKDVKVILTDNLNLGKEGAE